ncbi:hypothetical protein RJ55_08028 [Drechmeria coniospora]|nr:hypothetical protein RJ55_08028 [Drechmeria coniospora]
MARSTSSPRPRDAHAPVGTHRGRLCRVRRGARSPGLQARLDTTAAASRSYGTMEDGCRRFLQHLCSSIRPSVFIASLAAASTLSRVRRHLPTPFSTAYTFVLGHGGLCEMNLLVDPETGNGNSIIDRAAEASGRSGGDQQPTAHVGATGCGL